MFGLEIGNGFVWRIVVIGIRQGFWEAGTEFYETFEVFDGSAVLALGLGLIAEEERPCGGVFAGHARKAVSKAVGSVLLDDLFGLDLQFFMQRDEGVVIGERKGAIECGGAEAGFETRNAEEVVLGEGEARVTTPGLGWRTWR